MKLATDKYWQLHEICQNIAFVCRSALLIWEHGAFGGYPAVVFNSKVLALSCQEEVMTNIYCNKPDGQTPVQGKVTLNVCNVQSKRDVAIK